MFMCQQTLGAENGIAPPVPAVAAKAVASATLHESHSNECRGGDVWEFVEYVPSTFEKKWSDNINMWKADICKELNRQSNDTAKWIKTVEEDLKGPQHQVDTSIFSKHVYKTASGKTKELLLEPLAGILRHPYYCKRPALLNNVALEDRFIVVDGKRKDYLLDKDWLYLDWNIKEMKHDGGGLAKGFYFDAGASDWTSGAGGASQSWFHSIFTERGITFDGGMYLWEVTKHDPVHIFNLLPNFLIPFYHWYNIPCSAEKGNANNPIDMIKKLCKPRDFVVFKLDIDTPGVELPLMQQLVEDDVAIGLIDEMFFEYHVRDKYMGPIWGPSSGNMPGDMQTAYDLFLKLRQKGLRIHSWV